MIRRLIALLACLGLLLLFWQPFTKLVAQGIESARFSENTVENRNNLTVSAQGAFSCSNVVEIPQTECEALVALYNNTNGPNWMDHSGWLTTVTSCSWFGVNCLNNHVYFLNLSNNQLSGALPPQIGNFPEMLGIYMENNQINGNIPTQLSNLPKLIDLRLSNNQLSGSIPAQLGNLPTLYYLYLNNNQLSGSIPAQLGNRIGLIGLNLCCNQLSGNVPAQLGNLTELKALNLENNGTLSGALPDTLINLRKLATFWFHNTSLCEPNDNAFQTWLAGIANLNRTSVPCTARPSAEFDAWPQIGQASLTVSMHIVSTANITSCTWEYGDGQTGNSCAAYHDHVYTAAGTYTVKLTVSGPGGSDTKTRNSYIIVTTPPANAPPVAHDQNVTTSQNTATNITLTASDSDNDPLTYLLTSNPVHGSLSGTPPTLTYTPNANFSGSDSFTFKVNDGKADSNIATVNITITPVVICYTLVTGVNPSGGGTITSSPQPNCQGNKYQQGTVVSLSASASSGYAFSDWSGAASGNHNSLAVIMDGDKNVTANFIVVPPTNTPPNTPAAPTATPNPTCASPAPPVATGDPIRVDHQVTSDPYDDQVTFIWKPASGNPQASDQYHLWAKENENDIWFDQGYITGNSFTRVVDKAQTIGIQITAVSLCGESAPIEMWSPAPGISTPTPTAIATPTPTPNPGVSVTDFTLADAALYSYPPADALLTAKQCHPKVLWLQVTNNEQTNFAGGKYTVQWAVKKDGQNVEKGEVPPIGTNLLPVIQLGGKENVPVAVFAFFQTVQDGELTVALIPDSTLIPPFPKNPGPRRITVEPEPDVLICVTAYTSELAKLIAQCISNLVKGVGNIIGTGSPVYPLVINSTGQRAGFLKTGEIVEEIPGSHVVALGEERIVTYPGQDPVHVQVVGYATGIMNFAVGFMRADGAGVVAAHENVPVTQGMKATLNSTDSSYILEIDTNEDGQIDQSRPPDSVEQVFVSQVYLPLVTK